MPVRLGRGFELGGQIDPIDEDIAILDINSMAIRSDTG
jgi:hypothetical protein